MSRLDDIKEAYDNIQVPAELKERVLQSMERGKKDACGEKKESGKAFAGKSERNQKKGHLLPFVRVAEAVAAAVAVLVISVNVSPTVANAMEQVPVFGAIVKIVNFTTYSDKQEKKQMEATVKVPEVKVIGTDGKPLTRESKELNAAVSGYLDGVSSPWRFPQMWPLLKTSMPMPLLLSIPLRLSRSLLRRSYLSVMCRCSWA